MQDSREATALKWLGNTDRLSGEWGGSRRRLEEKGVRISLYYNQLLSRKNSGGVIREGDFGAGSSADLLIQFDLGRIGAVEGGEVLLHVKSNWSKSINPSVGALGDPLDDADGNLPVYVDQFWYQHSTAGRKFQLRVGYLDQQTILDRNAFANVEDKQFMNAYLDNNNAIVPLAIGPGAAAFLNPTPWLSFVVTASNANARPLRFSFDSTFEGKFLTYFETDLRVGIPSGGGPLTGNYRFGGFFDPRRTDLARRTRAERQNRGFYMSLDQMIFAENAESDEGLGVFFRYGRRPRDLNRIAQFWSAGAQYKGLLSRRSRDVLGIGAYAAIGSDVYRTRIAEDFDRETAYEIYYSVQIAPAMTLTPAFQYLKQPGALSSRENAAVVALRLRMTI